MNDVRCPSCRELDWYLDGLIVTEQPSGRLTIGQVESAAVNGSATGWSCMACGHEVPRWTELARRLDAAAGRALDVAS
jgi:hypothetical protein